MHVYEHEASLSERKRDSATYKAPKKVSVHYIKYIIGTVSVRY